MRRLALPLALAVLVVPAAAHAARWRYRFQPGHAYRYHYRERTTVRMRMPMLGARTEHLAMDTDFAIRVDRVLPGGAYDASVAVLAVRLTKADGRTLTLSHLPRMMRTVRAVISRRGIFHFYRRVVVEVTGGGAYALGVIDARHGTATSTVSAGGVTLTASASIDPRTGRVRALVVRRRARPRTRTVRARTRSLEVLPARILSLMALPPGPVEPGDHFALSNPAMKVTERVLAPAACGKASCGRIRLTARSDVRAASAEQTALAAAPKGERAGMAAQMAQANAQMHAEMAGMGGMPGMPGMGAAGGTPSMTSKIAATLAFDPAKGNLATVSGQATSATRAGGLRVKIVGTFSLAAR